MSAADISIHFSRNRCPPLWLEEKSNKKTRMFSTYYRIVKLHFSTSWRFKMYWSVIIFVWSPFFIFLWPEHAKCYVTLENCMSLKRKQGARVRRISLTVSCAPFSRAQVLCFVWTSHLSINAQKTPFLQTSQDLTV